MGGAALLRRSDASPASLLALVIFPPLIAALIASAPSVSTGPFPAPSFARLRATLDEASVLLFARGDCLFGS